MLRRAYIHSLMEDRATALRLTLRAQASNLRCVRDTPARAGDGLPREQLARSERIGRLALEVPAVRTNVARLARGIGGFGSIFGIVERSSRGIGGRQVRKSCSTGGIGQEPNHGSSGGSTRGHLEKAAARLITMFVMRHGYLLQRWVPRSARPAPEYTP